MRKMKQGRYDNVAYWGGQVRMVWWTERETETGSGCGGGEDRRVGDVVLGRTGGEGEGGSVGDSRQWLVSG